MQMQVQVHATDRSGHDNQYVVDRYPHECPLCHTSLYPTFLAGAYHHEDQINRVQAVFRCAKPACGQVFIADYLCRANQPWALGHVGPVSPQPESFPEQIKSISATFVQIHNQTVAAEAANLDQLTGIGLRKALEFLVKDFASHEKPNEKDKIRAAPLSQCIQNFIDDPKVKQCAKLASWLGNDETHYVRKWEDRDINDLKLLIQLTVNWIESTLLTKQYTREMEQRSGIAEQPTARDVTKAT